jgi:hypothetical protein
MRDQRGILESGEFMLKLFKLIPKNHEGFSYDYYNSFVIAAESIPDALEVMYKHVSPNKDAIPYYLRSSNITIEQIGNVELLKKGSQIIAYDFYSGD